MKIYYYSPSSSTFSTASFTNIQGDAGTTIVADGVNDTLSIIGDGTITTSTNGVTDTLTILLGTVPISKGGSGQTTANAALNAFLPTQTGNDNKFLKTDGTNTSWASVSTLDIVSYTFFGGF